MSERSRCGAVRILELAGEPSAGIGRVGSFVGEPSAGIGVVPRESLSSPMNPLRGSGVSERSRCGAVRILELERERERETDRERGRGEKDGRGLAMRLALRVAFMMLRKVRGFSMQGCSGLVAFGFINDVVLQLRRSFSSEAESAIPVGVDD